LIRSQGIAEPKRDALVVAAFAEIARRGFEGLRTREVANAVGVNIATLHYYFPHKEDLIRGVVAEAMERFRATLGGKGSAEQQLRAHFVGLRRLAREDPALFSVMAEFALRAARDKTLREIIRKTDDAWHATLRTLIRRAQKEGAVPKTLDPDGMAVLVVATLKGTFMLPVPETDRIERTLRQIETLLGLRAARAKTPKRSRRAVR
jgi:AcrR family transcriptional regulator